MLTSQISNSPDQKTKEWTQWNPNLPELQKFLHSTIVFQDKILYVCGCNEVRGGNVRAFNLVLADPANQKIKIVISIGPELEELCWPESSACYWKDSKIIVFGGWDFVTRTHKSCVAIVTLKGLDSETPTAHWERFNTTTQFHCMGHSAHIHRNRMVILGGMKNRKTPIDNTWYLNLDDGTWTEVPLPSEYSMYGARAADDNQVYYLSGTPQNRTLSRFDFDSLTWSKITIPKVPEHSEYIVSTQLLDGKMHFVLGDIKDKVLQVEPWVFDIESKTWTGTPASNCPLFGGGIEVNLRVTSSHVVLCGAWAGQPKYGEFWTFPRDSPTKTALKSSTILSNNQQIMLKFLKEAPYSDISFEVESQEIKAHKWWLCQKSRYFANMFASGMVEAQASRIKITDMTAPTFQAFLEFLYVDHVDLDNTLALELLQQADKFSVPELAKACEKHLAENLTPENYVVVSQMAEMLDIALLRESLINYIAKNIKQLKTRKDFGDISDNILRESIVKFIVK